MSPIFETKTAKIYQFPLNRRKSDSASRQPLGRSFQAESTVGPTIEYGSAWYHQAAVRDADRTRKP